MIYAVGIFYSAWDSIVRDAKETELGDVLCNDIRVISIWLYDFIWILNNVSQ